MRRIIPREEIERAFQAVNAGLSDADACAKFAISRTTYGRVRTLVRHGTPELIAAVKERRMLLFPAYNQCKPGARPGIKRRRAKRAPPAPLRPMRTLKPVPTREQVDPALANNPLAFAAKHGHVHVFTAEQQARRKFNMLMVRLRGFCKEMLRPELQPDAAHLVNGRCTEEDVRLMREGVSLAETVLLTFLEYAKAAEPAKAPIAPTTTDGVNECGWSTPCCPRQDLADFTSASAAPSGSDCQSRPSSPNA